MFEEADEGLIGQVELVENDIAYPEGLLCSLIDDMHLPFCENTSFAMTCPDGLFESIQVGLNWVSRELVFRNVTLHH